MWAKEALIFETGQSTYVVTGHTEDENIVNGPTYSCRKDFKIIFMEDIALSQGH